MRRGAAGSPGRDRTLTRTMDTTFATGRRSLPPVPRSATDDPVPGGPPARTSADGAHPGAPASRAAEVARPAPREAPDDGQAFVARLRGAAPAFAAAAGARSAVVREAVPPARHRRARCRLVLRYADGTEVDLTFLGSAGRPGAAGRHGFPESIQRWLETGRRREPEWLVPDADAADGTAVDVPAWLTAG
jgi:hypothetical protein